MNPLIKSLLIPHIIQNNFLCALLSVYVVKKLKFANPPSNQPLIIPYIPLHGSKYWCP